MPTPFITVQDLADHIGRDLSDDMTAAYAAIESACDVCRDVSFQNFTAGTATLAIDGTGTDVLLLAERPVGTVTAVTINGVAEPNFVYDEHGFLFRGTAGPLLGRPVWPDGRRNIMVTYEYGYDLIDVPSTVRQVALDLAARRIIQGVASSENVGDASITYAQATAQDLTENELRILRYKRQTRSF